MINRLLTLSDFLSKYSLFPKMGVSQLTDEDSKKLDELLNFRHGSMPLTLNFRRLYVSMDVDMVNEIVTNEKLDMLCMLLYFTHKTKWDKLIEYSTKDYDPLHTSVSKSTREYGHVIDNTDGGSDETNSSVGLYGFDSTDPVPSDENTIKNSYGKTVKVTNSGNDVTTVERQSGLTSALWDNDLRFWEHNNVPITMVDDVFKSICDNLYLDRESLEDRLVN